MSRLLTTRKLAGASSARETESERGSLRSCPARPRASTAGPPKKNESSHRYQSEYKIAPRTLPVLGLRGRWFPLHHSSRLCMEGFANGMYFFGYGNFSFARGLLGAGRTHHLSLNAGYQLGSRFSIHGISEQIGVRLTEKGPVAGLEFSW